jgi:dihydroneopterin aldolase
MFAETDACHYLRASNQLIMGLIRIEQMEFYSYHGCFEEERIVGNRFIVDLEMTTDMTRACATDKIDDALNYQTAYDLIKSEMKTNSYLLEHIACRILDALFSKFPELDSASVKVSKMNPPMGGKIGSVSVEISRKR